MSQRRIYVASSWRNNQQPKVVEVLRSQGYDVYDFHNPAKDNNGFSWEEVDKNWESWTPRHFANKVTTDTIAAEGFAYDKAALDGCDTLVLLLPCGKSAHLEAGYAAGQGKQVIVVLHWDGFEPELMYLLADAIVTNVDEMLAFLRDNPRKCGAYLSEPEDDMYRRFTSLLRTNVQF
jgi:hypothetical protein